MYNLVSQSRKQVTVYLKENVVERQDNFIQYFGQQTDTFYTVSGDREQYTNMYETEYFTAEFKLDSETQTFNRTVYSLLDLIAQIGGVFSVIQLICAVVFGYYAQKMLELTVLKLCYQFESAQDCLKNDSFNSVSEVCFLVFHLAAITRKS